VVIDHAASHNIKAAVFMHGAKDTAHLHTPSMFMTAEDDTWASSDPAQAYNEATELHHKVLTKQMTGGHLEPLGGHPAKLNVYAGKFLSCFLRHAATHCQAFYGPATSEIQTVCQAPNVEYKDCRVAGDSPVSGTTPAPTDEGACTSEGVDPYSSGHEAQCCDGLQKCIGDWSGDGNWHYLCKTSCSSSFLSRVGPHNHRRR